MDVGLGGGEEEQVGRDAAFLSLAGRAGFGSPAEIQGGYGVFQQLAEAAEVVTGVSGIKPGGGLPEGFGPGQGGGGRFSVVMGMGFPCGRIVEISGLVAVRGGLDCSQPALRR